MTYSVTVENFADWRLKARTYFAAGIRPEHIIWHDAVDTQNTLLFADAPPPPASDAHDLRVPPAFVELAKTVAAHRDATRWGHLYNVLWRLSRGQRHVLQLHTDQHMHALRGMEKAVRRDIHKMKAFVHFRLCKDDAGEDHYIAWHCPDHRIVRLAAPFFAKRFEVMRWMILTPDECARWDGTQLSFAAGVTADMAPGSDALEEVWRRYYRATFNPARIKLKTMKREMPVRHWKTLPETALIKDMLEEAPARVEAMIEQSRKMLES